MMDALEEGNGAPFSIICRTCLKAKQGMKSVYSATIPDMLMYCVSLKVEHGDGLPNLICPQCLKQINQLFSFKQLCEKSESLLKQYLPLRIIPAQDLTVEDVTQNQILDTLEDPTLTSTSLIPNEPLVESFYEEDPADTDNLIPLAICLPQYGDNSLFGHEVDLESERSLYILRDDDFVDSYFDVTSNSWTDSTDILLDKDIIPIIGVSEEQQSFPCEECKEVLTCSEDLSVHMSMHTPGGVHKCNVCVKVFHRKESLKRHIKRHMKDKPMSCHLCEKKFSDKCDLKRHLKRHADWVEKPHVCTECGKTYTDAQNLTVHMRVHSGLKPYACQLCPSTFSDKRLLRSHYNTHSDEKKYHCNECGKSFKSPSVLSEHSRIHTGIKPHKCDTCGKEFTQASNLQHHLNSHSSERTFACLLCNDHIYKRISSLKEHMAKSHPETAEATRTKKCNVCNQEFQKFSELVAHRNQHKTLPYKCHVCGKAFPQKYRRKRHMLSHMKKGEIKEVNGNYILEEEDSGEKQNNEEANQQQSIEAEDDVQNNTTEPDVVTVKVDDAKPVEQLKELNIEGNGDSGVEYTALRNMDGPKAVRTQVTDDVFIECPHTLEPECTIEENILSPIDEAILNKSYQNGSTNVLATPQYTDISHSSQSTWVQQETGEVVVTPNPVIQFDGFSEDALPVIQLTDIHANGLKDKDGNYECKICKIKVTKYKDLWIHMSLHPINTSTWECNYCRKRFSKKTFLSRHIKIHMTREMYPCAHCDKKFYEKSKLRKHVIKSHPEVSETPPASSEEEKSQTSIIDNTQISNNLPQTPTSYTQLSLDNSCRSIIPLKQTQVSLDLSPNQSQTSLLNMSPMSLEPIRSSIDISQTNNLEMRFNNDNIRMLNLNSQQIVNCTPTRIMSHGPQLIVNPVQSISTFTSPLTTVDLTQSVEDPQQRLENSQDSEMEYSCDVCGKKYGKAIKLSLHMRTHNQSQESETSYTCQVCQQTFLNMSALVQHSQTHIDTNTFTHSCDACQQQFTTLSDLNSHKKCVHSTPSKPVPLCKICGKSFTSMYKRRKHMQMHKLEAENSNNTTNSEVVVS